MSAENGERKKSTKESQMCRIKRSIEKNIKGLETEKKIKI